MKKIIKNGMLCTESGVYEADLLLEEGVIREIGTDLQDSGAEVVDAKGKYVLPGAVDIHTHMDLDVGIARVIDDFYTGTIAAACGGTTSIVDHMAFGPQNCSLWHQVKEYHRLADGNAVVDYGFHGVFQHVNPQVLEEMGEIAKEEGITSFKVYMTYGYGLGDSDLMQITVSKAVAVGHIYLKAGDPLFLCNLSHFFQDLWVHMLEYTVESIVDHGISIGQPVVFLYLVPQAAVLRSEGHVIHNGGGAAAGCRNGSGVEIIDDAGNSHIQIHVGVDIHSARKYILSSSRLLLRPQNP